MKRPAKFSFIIKFRCLFNRCLQINKLINMHYPWQQAKFQRKWASKPAQTVNSPQYKQLKRYIHMPYRRIDHTGVKCFYFPTYPVFKIKNITEFDFQSLSAKINGVLVIKIRVDYQDYFTPQGEQKDTPKIKKALESLFKIAFGNIKNQRNSLRLNQSKYMQSLRNIPRKVENRAQSKLEEVQESSINLKKYLYIQFNRDDPLRLPSKRVFEGQIKQQEKTDAQGTFIIWTIRKQFKIALSPGTLWQDLIAPFNLLNFKLTLSFEDIDINLTDNQQPERNQLVKFKFNCMKRVGNDSFQERKHVFQQLRFTDDGTLGEYDLAQTGLNVSCQKYLSKQNNTDISSQYRSFKVITFTIPFYKYPIMDSLTIFIPLVLITILTLFTFVQGPDFNDKIGNIATLMIVYVGLMPVISDSLPPTTSITLIDIVVYCQLTISVLCLIRGYIIKQYSVSQFNNYSVFEDPIFRFAVAIAIATVIILGFLLIYYIIKKAFYYNMQEADLDEIDHKLSHWVSPHMHNIARNIKTGIQKQKMSQSLTQNNQSNKISHNNKISKNNPNIIMTDLL